MQAIEIEWGSASVDGARLTVALTGKPSKDWREAFERVFERLGSRGSGWGDIELAKRELQVDAVEPGAENDLRHLLESVVLQANASIGAEPGDDEAEERSGPDEEMTERFRSFAGQGS